MEQVAWIAVLLDDVESDMSVFHRVDDFRALSARRFFLLAERLPYYEGASRWSMQKAMKDRDEQAKQLPESLVDASTAGALPTMPGMPSVFDFATA